MPERRVIACDAPDATAQVVAAVRALLNGPRGEPLRRNPPCANQTHANQAHELQAQENQAPGHAPHDDPSQGNEPHGAA